THSGHLLDGVRHQVIRPGRGYALVAPSHRLAGRKSVRVAEFGDDDFVLLDVPAVRDNQLPKLRAGGVEPNVRWRTTSFGVIGRNVCPGWSRWAAMVPNIRGAPSVLSLVSLGC